MTVKQNMQIILSKYVAFTLVDAEFIADDVILEYCMALKDFFETTKTEYTHNLSISLHISTGST